MKRRRFLGCSLAVAMLPAIPALAQSTQQPFTPQQLDQLLAPVALYPDAVLAQTLMAATYPLEVVQAARWSKDNPNLKGDAAVAAVKDKDWDVSVKSLVAFPQTLSMMNANLDWTQKVGDAMIGQQKDVADSIQRLRARAQAAGNLKSTPQQTVSTQSSGGQNAIVIAPANPETVYVPYYNPNWAYGQWPYPSYPPSYYPPSPLYGYGSALLSGMMFGLGVAATASLFGGWHWGWNGSGWGGSYSTVNVNRAVNISGNNFNASRYADGRWNFDAAHRDAVPYRTQAERQMYNQVRPDAQQREQFRGQLEGRGGQFEGRGGQAVNRGAVGGGGRASAFDGVERGGQVNRDYSRGNQSWGNRSFEGSNFSRGGGGFERGGGGFERGGGGFERGGGGFRR